MCCHGFDDVAMHVVENTRGSEYPWSKNIVCIKKAMCLVQSIYKIYVQILQMCLQDYANGKVFSQMGAFIQEICQDHLLQNTLLKTLPCPQHMELWIIPYETKCYKGHKILRLKMHYKSENSDLTLRKQAKIHQVTTMLGARAIIKVSGHQYRWLAGGYDLEIGHFLEVACMVVTWCTWIKAFLCSETSNISDNFGISLWHWITRHAVLTRPCLSFRPKLPRYLPERHNVPMRWMRLHCVSWCAVCWISAGSSSGRIP